MKKKIFREFVLPCAFSFIFSYLYAVLLTKVSGIRADFPFYRRRYLALFLTPIFFMLYYFIKNAYRGHEIIEVINKSLVKLRWVFILLFAIIAFALWINADIENNANVPNICKVRGSISSISDLEIEQGNYIVTGEKPSAVYEILENQYRYIFLGFTNKLKNDTDFTVYYISSEDEEYSEENNMCVTVRADMDYVLIDLYDSYNISQVRVDYKGTQGDIYSIKEVALIRNTHIFNILKRLNADTCIKILIALVMILGLYISQISFSGFWEKICDYKRVRTIIDLLAIFLLPIILLWQYLSGQKTMIYIDIAGDTLNQTYPVFYHIAERVANSQWASQFDFSNGIGNPANYLFPSLFDWVAFFGTDNIAYLMGIRCYLNMALAGVCAYKLVQLFGVSDYWRIAIALGYEFNAMLTIRTFWAAYAVVSFSVILWLLSFELFYRNETRRLYKLQFFLFTEICCLQLCSCSIYYFLLYSGCFIVYSICRVLTDGGGVRKAFYYVCRFVAFAFFASADMLSNSVAAYFSSTRFGAGIDSASSNIYEHIYFRWVMLYEAFIRTIGQTIQGFSGDFLGINNVLEGPAFYFGILLFMALPSAFFNLPKKKKKIFGIGLMGAVLFIGCPFLRELVAGLSGATFKYTSFWIVILWLFIILEALQNIKKDGMREGTILIFNITSLIVLLLYISILFSGEVARAASWWIGLIYIFAYIVFINLHVIYGKRFEIILSVIVLTEGLVLSWGVFNGSGRNPLTKEQVDACFNNSTNFAIQTVKGQDINWYRINTYPIEMTSSLVQGYYGTASYVGGSGINNAVQNYISELGHPQNGIRWIYGTNGNLYANSLLGVKYLFSNTEDNEYGYELLDIEDDIYVYKNNLALPIGYFYDDTIDVETFEKMNFLERGHTLLNKCLVQTPGESVHTDSSNNAEYNGDYIECSVENLREGVDLSEYSGCMFAIQLLFREGDANQEDNKTDKSGVHLVDKSNLDLYNGTSKDEHKGLGQIRWSNIGDSSCSRDFIYGGVIELSNPGITNVKIDDSSLEDIEGARIYIYDNVDEYYSSAVRDIKKLADSGINLSKFENNKIEGEINATSKGIFATSIPFDDNWEIYVDGEKQKIWQVNTGFIGCYIDEGKHEIQIIYKSKLWLFENKWKFFGVAIIIIMLINNIITSKKERLKNGKKSISISTGI